MARQDCVPPVLVQRKDATMPEAQPELQIRMLIEGEIAQPDVSGLELESARRAMSLLRKRISPEQMEAILSEDLKETDAKWREWASKSDGTWQVAEVEFQIPGLTSAQFQEWWASSFDDLHDVVYPAFPEHYRFGWVADPQGGVDPVFLIVEELGHVPFRMYCTFGDRWAPVEVTPGFQMMQPGVGRLHDGTEVVRFMNQIKDTEDGFTMKAGVYMASAVPAAVVRSHLDQEMVEWTSWFRMAHAAVHSD
jgi:hypothetical protein